jgi:hypothetical protein
MRCLFLLLHPAMLRERQCVVAACCGARPSLMPLRLTDGPCVQGSSGVALRWHCSCRCVVCAGKGDGERVSAEARGARDGDIGGLRNPVSRCPHPWRGIWLRSCCVAPRVFAMALRYGEAARRQLPGWQVCARSACDVVVTRYRTNYCTQARVGGGMKGRLASAGAWRGGTEQSAGLHVARLPQNSKV